MTDPMQGLRVKFLARCEQDLAILENEPPGDASPALRQAVHRLAGAAGVFGFPDLSALALTVDDRLHEGEIPSAHDMEALIRALRAVL